MILNYLKFLYCSIFHKKELIKKQKIINNELINIGSFEYCGKCKISNYID